MNAEVAEGALEVGAIEGVSLLTTPDKALLRQCRANCRRTLSTAAAREDGQGGAGVVPSGPEVDLTAELARMMSAEEFATQITSDSVGDWGSLVPDWASKCIISSMNNEHPVIIDKQSPDTAATMEDEVKAFKRSVRSLVEKQATLTEDQMQVVLCVALLFNTVQDMARSDITVAKTFSVLAGHKYRSHNGVLFVYRNGVWSKTPAIDYGTAERILDVTMAAESVLAIMSIFGPKRTLEDVIFEAVCILLTFEETKLRQILLRAPKKRDASEEWAMHASLSCLAVRKIFAERLHWVTEKFHHWASTDAPDTKPKAVTFLDCSLRIEDTDIKSCAWSPDNNCYWVVKCCLSMPPDYDILAMIVKFLATTFAGLDMPFKMVMALISLAARGEIMPHIMLFLVGPGGEGKTLFALRFLRQIFGTGHGECTASMLQDEQEFRKQGHRFVMKSWLAFDEMKPNCALEEDTFKILTAGGKLDLRKNHEAETGSAGWPRAGKSWNGNVKDIPRVNSAREPTFARRLRCVRLRARFTSNKDEVDYSKHIFPVDMKLEEAMEHPAVAAMFWRFMLIPFMQQTPVEQAKDLVMNPCQQVVDDTEWLKAAMLGHVMPQADEASPGVAPQHSPRNANANGPCGAQGVKAEQKATAIPHEAQVAVDTFKHMVEKKPGERSWRPAQINSTKVGANTGLTKGKPGHDTKFDVLVKSAKSTPHLWKIIVGERSYSGQQCQRIYRRNFDLARYEVATAAVLQGSDLREADVFGSWDEQAAGWANKAEGDVIDVEDDGVDDLPAHADDAMEVDLKVVELVHLENLREYMRTRTDRRQPELEAYVQEVTKKGRQISADIWELNRVYFRKKVAGVVCGRMYGERVSLQHLTKEARAAACETFCIDVDMENAFYSLLDGMHGEHSMITKYKMHASLYRSVVARYYNIDTTAAKVVLLKAMYGYTKPPQGRDALGVLPFVESLAHECLMAKERLSFNRENLVKHFKEKGRRDPQASAMAYALMDREHWALCELLGLLDKYGLRLVSPIFDGAIVTSNTLQVGGDTKEATQKMLDEFHAQTNVVVKCKPWAGRCAVELPPAKKIKVETVEEDDGSKP